MSASEFGRGYTIPPVIKKMLRNHIIDDLSYKNDISPSFGMASHASGAEVRIWINHDRKSEREYQESKRYLVDIKAEDKGKVLYHGDSIDEAVMKYLQVISSLAQVSLMNGELFIGSRDVNS